MPLSDDVREMMNELERTFHTPGYNLITQKFQAEAETIPVAAFFSAKSWEDIVAARIRYEVLMDFLRMPDDIRADREALEEDQTSHVETDPV